jgi:hydroxymethylglutaryl-CoA lyase
MANVRKTVDESFAQLEEMTGAFPDMHIILDAATAFGCPIEGITSYESLKSYMERARGLGIDACTLCDTIGVANPNQVREYITRLRGDFPGMTFRVHIHDTRNMGMINSLAAIECGIADIEVAVGGLGGCPFAQGASGNTSTEDFVYMLHELGYETGIDFDKLLETANYAKEHVRGNFSGHHINITRHCRVQ